jgi:hypothetical protein
MYKYHLYICTRPKSPYLVDVRTEEIHGGVDGLDLEDYAEPEADAFRDVRQDPNPMLDGLADDGVLKDDCLDLKCCFVYHQGDQGARG